MKNFRKHFGAAALIATAALAGCSGRDDGEADSGTPDPGCTGACSTDAGTDGGSNNGRDAGTDGGSNTGTDAGTDGGTNSETDGGNTESDGGTENNCPAPVDGLGPIGQLKATSGEGVRSRFEGLVVTGVDFVSNRSDAGYSVQFWVVHPCFPKEGLYIERFGGNGSANPNLDYIPVAGDIVTVDGLFRHYQPNGFDAPTSRVSYRAVLKDAFKLTGITGNIEITKTGHMDPLPDTEVDAGTFGNSVQGSIKANPELEGGRVYIPGPITITDSKPLALKAFPNNARNSLYYGFEVSGGILVLNQETFRNCDYRAIAADGGTVTFHNGIRGVWDTYTLVQSFDGGTRTIFADGIVPGVLEDGGIGAVADYTYVLHPLNCDVDLTVGDAGTPVETPDAGTGETPDAG